VSFLKLIETSLTLIGKVVGRYVRSRDTFVRIIARILPYHATAESEGRCKRKRAVSSKI
jgi:hypothetical protein